MPTPASLAIASSATAASPAVNARRAAASRFSRLRCASARTVLPGPRPLSGGTSACSHYRSVHMSTTIAGRPVNRIGYGAMHLSRLDQQDAVAFLRHVVARWINHLDTAQFYETSNAVIRAARHPYPDDLVLATKVGAEH